MTNRANDCPEKWARLRGFEPARRTEESTQHLREKRPASPVRIPFGDSYLRPSVFMPGKTPGTFGAQIQFGNDSAMPATTNRVTASRALLFLESLVNWRLSILRLNRDQPAFLELQ